MKVRALTGWLAEYSPQRSLRGRFALALGMLVLLASLNAVAFSWGSARRNVERDNLETGLLRFAAVTELRAGLESESRRIQTLASLVGLGGATASEQAEAEKRLARLQTSVTRLRTSAAATPASDRLSDKTLRLTRAWRAIHAASDAAQAIEHLVFAERLTRELLASDYPASIAALSAEMRTATEKNRANERLVARFTWLMLICSAVFSAWVVMALSRRLIRDVETLRAGAERLGAGDLDHRVATASRDELGSVADSFDKTRVQLRDAQQRLEAKRVELETTLASLRATQNELVQSEKLSALGSMLAGLAHELNNPLAAILATSELLQGEMAESKDEATRLLGGEFAVPLVRESLRARALVRSLLRFSRDTELKLRAADLSDAVMHAIRLRRHQFDHECVELVVDIPAGLHVKAEPLRLQQVCFNIITNAIDALAGGRGTRLRISARETAPAGVELTFEDDGPGMLDPERVFEPFYTTKEVGKGTGLGLAIVHRLITEFGGSIVAENGAARGARFAITLDRASPETDIPVEPARLEPAMAPTATAARILVVDDEPALRAVQQKMLQRAGFEVTVAGSAREAREALTQTMPDLVISDVKMPGEDGVALYDWACAQSDALASRFVFVTGDIQETLVARLGSQCAGRIMQKPFKSGEYIDTVRARLTAIARVVAAAALFMWSVGPATAQSIVPVRAVQRADTAHTSPRTGQEVTITGRVTLGWGVIDTTEINIHVQDSTGGVFVDARQPRAFRPILVGDSVIVTGTIDRDHDRNTLDDASVTVLGTARREVLPARVKALQLAHLSRLAGALVTVEGFVLRAQVGRGDQFLMVRDSTEEGMSVRVYNEAEGNELLRLDRFVPGDRLRVTGVLVRRTSRRNGNPRFTIYPRTGG